MKINVDEAFISEVARVIKKVDGARFADGMSGENNATSLVIGPPHPGNRGTAASVNGKRVLVEVTAVTTTDPSGKYTGKLQVGPVGGGSSGGGFNDGLTCEAWNLWEVGLGGNAHNLAANTGPYMGVVTGSNTTTGNLVVHFYALPAGVSFVAQIGQDGGTYGSQSGTSSWTYTVTSFGGMVLGTNMTPSRTRPTGKYMDGNYGLCCYNAGGTLLLIDAGETLAVTTC